MRPNIIYSSTRSIKCRDLRNLLEFKKIEVIIFFFNFRVRLLIEKKNYQDKFFRRKRSRIMLKTFTQIKLIRFKTWAHTKSNIDANQE